MHTSSLTQVQYYRGMSIDTVLEEVCYVTDILEPIQDDYTILFTCAILQPFHKVIHTLHNYRVIMYIQACTCMGVLVRAYLAT